MCTVSSRECFIIQNTLIQKPVLSPQTCHTSLLCWWGYFLLLYHLCLFPKVWWARAGRQTPLPVWWCLKSQVGGSVALMIHPYVLVPSCTHCPATLLPGMCKRNAESSTLGERWMALITSLPPHHSWTLLLPCSLIVSKFSHRVMHWSMM